MSPTTTAVPGRATHAEAGPSGAVDVRSGEPGGTVQRAGGPWAPEKKEQ